MAASKTWLAKLRNAFCNPYTLAVALYGFGFFFLLSRGPDHFFVYLAQGLVIIHLLFPEFRRSCIRGPYLALVLTALLPVATTLLMPEDLTYRRYFDNVFDFIWIVLAMRFFLLQVPETVGRLQARGALALLCVLVSGHVVAMVPAFEPRLIDPTCYGHGLGLKCGLFPTAHVLALFAVVTLPLAIYLTWYLSGTWRIVAAAAVIGVTYLAVISGSRPGWIAILFGMVVTVLYLVRTSRKWWVVLALLALPAVVYFSGVGLIVERIDDFLVNIRSEERLVIWPDTWRMIQDNSAREWFVGRGIGSYRYFFPDYSTVPEYAPAVFSHNFALDILFESGVLGLALIGGGLVAFLLALARASRLAPTVSLSYFYTMMFATCVMFLVHTFLTLPFYSSPTLLPLAMVVGLGLAMVVQQNDRRAATDIPRRG